MPPPLRSPGMHRSACRRDPPSARGSGFATRWGRRRAQGRPRHEHGAGDPLAGLAHVPAGASFTCRAGCSLSCDLARRLGLGLACPGAPHAASSEAVLEPATPARTPVLVTRGSITRADCSEPGLSTEQCAKFGLGDDHSRGRRFLSVQRVPGAGLSACLGRQFFLPAGAHTYDGQVGPAVRKRAGPTACRLTNSMAS